MVSHYPAKLSDHRHCSSGDMLLVVEEDGSKGRDDMAQKHTAYHIKNSDLAHARLKQQSEKNMKIFSVCPSENVNEKEK